MAIFWCSLAGLIVGMCTGRVMNGRVGPSTFTADGGCYLLTNAGAGLIGASLADFAFRLLGLASAHITVYEFAAELFGAFLLTTLVYVLQKDSSRPRVKIMPKGEREMAETIDACRPQHKHTGTYS